MSDYLHSHIFRRTPLLLALLPFFAGCATTGEPGNSAEAETKAAASTLPAAAVAPGQAATPEQPAPSAPAASTPDKKVESAKIFKGTGVMVKPPAPDKPAASGAVSLNFEGADIRDIAKTVLAEILKESYIVDPKVTGTISFRTTRPMPKESLLPTLETVLRMNGVVLVKENDIFKVMPAATVRGSLAPRMGSPLSGFSMQVVPLQYIGAKEMAKMLEAVTPDPSTIKADEVRNLLVLAGTQNELQHMLEMVDMFDVDWLSGMSVGLFILQSADVKSVDKELSSIFTDKAANPLAGVVRIIPIERLNAFVIITPQPKYLEQAKLWLERLDRAGGTGGTRLFVYQVQNGKAEHLAELLNQTFGGNKSQSSSSGKTTPTVAAGLAPTQIRSSTSARSTLGSSLNSNTSQTNNAANDTAQVTGASLTIADEAGGSASEVRVVADKENNALLILANSAGYERIEGALKKLDVAPRQVLIEVTIAEVTLTDGLNYGVEWNFTNGARKSGYLDTDGKAGVGQLIPGFSYALAAASGDGLKAALNMLATNQRIKILSSPHLMVADNQTAKIQVGYSVPTATSSTVYLGTDTTTSSNAVTSSIQYLDTGVMMSVTPRINAGGLVNLDITQEVSDASETKTSSLNSPTISKRATQTKVQVQSGETMVLGGLISEKTDNTDTGLPVLSSIPLLGGLFGNQSKKTTKTELVMLITPRVANNPVQAKQISNELQRKMSEAKDLLDCGTSNAFGYTTRGGLWCMQPGRLEGSIDRMKETDADGQPVYLKLRPSTEPIQLPK